jgi:hypothetical protein
MIKGTAIAAVFSLVFTPFMAFAAPPQIVEMPPPPDVTFQNFCAFPVLVHTTGRGIAHVFFNNEGAVRDVIITAPNTTLTFTNVTNGHSISTPSVNMVRQSFDGDTVTVSLRGLLDRFVVPGRGLVMADVGRVDMVFTLDSNGNVTSAEQTFASGQQDNGLSPALCPLIQ